MGFGKQRVLGVILVVIGIVFILNGLGGMTGFVVFEDVLGGIGREWSFVVGIVLVIGGVLVLGLEQNIGYDSNVKSLRRWLEKREGRRIRPFEAEKIYNNPDLRSKYIRRHYSDNIIRKEGRKIESSTGSIQKHPVNKLTPIHTYEKHVVPGSHPVGRFYTPAVIKHYKISIGGKPLSEEEVRELERKVFKDLLKNHVVPDVTSGHIDVDLLSDFRGKYKNFKRKIVDGIIGINSTGKPTSVMRIYFQYNSPIKDKKIRDKKSGNLKSNPSHYVMIHAYPR